MIELQQVDVYVVRCSYNEHKDYTWEKVFINEDVAKEYAEDSNQYFSVIEKISDKYYADSDNNLYTLHKSNYQFHDIEYIVHKELRKSITSKLTDQELVFLGWKQKQ